MAEVKRRRRQGEQVSLVDVMVIRGLLTPTQARELVEFQATELTVCPKCNAIYNIEGVPSGKEIRCNKCRQVFVIQKFSKQKFDV